jgi:hypothetical protein
MLYRLERGPQTFGPEARTVAEFLLSMREITIEALPGESFRAEITDEGRAQLHRAPRARRERGG